jgi:hypothetical protein
LHCQPSHSRSMVSTSSASSRFGQTWMSSWRVKFWKAWERQGHYG